MKTSWRTWGDRWRQDAAPSGTKSQNAPRCTKGLRRLRNGEDGADGPIFAPGDGRCFDLRRGATRATRGCQGFWRRHTKGPAALLATVLIGCTTDPLLSSRAHAPASHKPLPRYWLRDTELFDKHRTTQAHQVTAPVLVEVFPDGRVRAVPGASEAFEGYLPEMLQYLPGEYGQGLLLYAQRAADLHIDRPSGPTAGSLHPGAFVTVAPGDDAQLLIGLPGFFRHDQPMVAFVDKDALGTNPIELVSPTPNRRVRAYLGHPCTLGIGDGEKSAKVDTSSCTDLWVGLESRSDSQRIGGVELRGVCTDLSELDGPRSSRSFLSLDCPAHAVSGDGSKLCLHGAASERGRSTLIADIPAGFERVRLPSPDPLAEAIRQGRSVWWLVERETAKDRVRVSCEPWKFDMSRGAEGSGSGPIEGRLLAPRPWRGEIPRYPFTYRPSEGKNPARLHLGQLVHSPYGTLREYDYKLLHSVGDELHMMGRPIPNGIVAYDPGEAERWFLSRSACEAARTVAIATLERDPSQSTRIGFRCDILYGS